MTGRLTYLFFLSVLWCVAPSCKAQMPVPPEPNRAGSAYLISGAYSLMEVDNLGFIYLVNEENVISKFTSEGKLLFEFSLNRLGDIHSMDVSNPQKILVYYGDYNNVVFLDNTLSEMTRISLENYGFWNTTAVCISREGNIWLFDPVDRVLQKTDQSGNELIRSYELYNVLESDISRARLFEYERNLYLATDNYIYRFDNFAKFIQKKAIPSSETQYFERHIAYLDNGSIYFTDLLVQMEEEERVLHQGEGLRDFHVGTDRTYLLDKNGLMTLSL